MRVFVTGASGYIASRLIPALLARGHQVQALVRPGAEHKLAAGCQSVSANALDAASYAHRIAPADTLVHLVGTPHPTPWKARSYRAVDLVSVQAAVTAAVAAGIRHFVYVSVAQPAPVMRAYVEVRARGEQLIGASGIDATMLRPWYVLGPGHRWPLLLLPAYWIMERFGPARDLAQRLALLRIGEMIGALVWAIEHPPQGVRILDVIRIRELGVA